MRCNLQQQFLFVALFFVITDIYISSTESRIVSDKMSTDENIYGTFSSRNIPNNANVVDITSPLSPIHNTLHHTCSAEDTSQLGPPITKSHGLSSEEAAKLLLKHGEEIYFAEPFFNFSKI